VHKLDKDLDAYEERLNSFSQQWTKSDLNFYENLDAGYSCKNQEKGNSWKLPSVGKLKDSETVS
jgi:hypothetical protein